jgi:hypothetical protein
MFRVPGLAHRKAALKLKKTADKLRSNGKIPMREAADGTIAVLSCVQILIGLQTSHRPVRAPSAPVDAESPGPMQVASPDANEESESIAQF